MLTQAKQKCLINSFRGRLSTQESFVFRSYLPSSELEAVGFELVAIIVSTTESAYLDCNVAVLFSGNLSCKSVEA